MWVYRAQRGPFSGPGPVPLGANVIFCILMVRSSGGKYGCVGRNEALPAAPGPFYGAVVSEKKFLKKNFSSFDLYKTLYLVSCWSDLLVENHLEERAWGYVKGLYAPYTPIIFRPDRTNRSRDITVCIAQRKKIFSLTIVISETVAPRGTGPGPLEMPPCEL
ncbi:hypothetical protein HZH68_003923 [Vespula germanica]|uniref:Uncharacterized protein n=1 Tax=Vespula germanica TaxID=30212 RepID=A0A834KP86_VESGE|nr:hypothetical protein HZH68_003923 [Vespula germanica]